MPVHNPSSSASGDVSGTTGQIAKFTSSSSVGNSIIFESGGSVLVEGPVAAQSIAADAGSDLTVFPATLGSELVSNGTFTTNLTGWSGANWAQSSGAALHTAGAATSLTQAACVGVVGTTYKVTYTLTAGGGGSVRVYFAGVFGPSVSSTGTYTDYITATSETDALEFVPTSAFNGSIDSVSVKALTNAEVVYVDSAAHFRRPMTVYGGINIPNGHPVSIGFQALPLSTTGIYNIPASNMGIGDHAAASATTGHITAVGYYAGSDFTDGNLTVFGKWAGTNCTSGVYATFFGNAAGLSNTTGDSAAFGDEAGSSNQTADIAVFGNYAGFSTTVAMTAVGHHALRYNTIGESTGVGYLVGTPLTTGNGILIGHRAGYLGSGNDPVTDTDFILIGDNSSRTVASGTTLTNYIGIGDNVRIDSSNQVVLGNSSITATKLYGDVTSTGSINTGGASASANFPIRSTNSADAIARWEGTNTNAGTGAGFSLDLVSNAGTGSVRMHSTAHSVWPGKLLVNCSSGGTGVVINTGGSSDPIEFYTNNTERAEFNDSGLSVFGVIVESTDTISGAGAVSVTKTTTKVTTTGDANALTLADGVNGQVKRIVHDVDGGSFVLTPTTKTGWSTFTSTAVGETISLQFVTTRGWMVIGSYGGTIAP